MRRALAFAPWFGLAFAACTHAEPTPTAINSAPLSRTAAVGHELYLAKCQMCHELVEPAQFSRAEWPKKFPTFAKRARLNPDQYQEILAYLEEASGR